MTALPRPYLVVPMLAAVLALGACSSGPKDIAATSSTAPTAADEIEDIAALLDRGEPGAAKRRIKHALERDPMNPSLLVLLQGIEIDAREALGPASYPYTVQPGDTMSALAERFLGNRLKSYQLAQYNGIDTPADLAPGTELRIPGQPHRAEPARRSEPARSSSPPALTPRERPSAAEAPAPEPPARKSGDPAAAQRARSAGLTALNQGKISQALTLLRRAAALDPGNAAIAADLARAERIARTVRSRR
jgi:LysM repeat protein